MAIRARIILLSAAVAAGLVGAPAAAALPGTDFCRSMEAVGFTGDCATITTLGLDACTLRNRGVGVGAVAQRLDLATNNQNLSNYIIAGAALYLCPQRPAAT